jgi:tetratricopeptide (TPR) repeat protein
MTYSPDIEIEVSTLDQWLHNIGNFNHPNHSEIIGEGHFSSLSRKLIKENAGDESAKVNEITTLYYEGLLLARKFKIKESHRLFEDAEKLLESSTLSNLSNSYINTIAFPAKAYLCYKIEEFQLAKSFLYEAIKVDEYLENKGFNVLHYHRVQQLHNLSRMSFKKNENDEALNTVKEVIDYLTIGISPKTIGNWDFKELSNQSSELRSAMLYQVISETLANILRIYQSEPEMIKSTIKTTFVNLENFESVTSDEKVLILWFKIICNFHIDDLDRMLSKSEDFFKYQNHNFDIFKLSILQQVLIICNSNLGEDSYLFFDKTIKNLIVPEDWKLIIYKQFSS